MSYARIDRISQEVRRELSMLIPMLKEAILYAQAQGVEIVSVQEAYQAIYE